MISVTFVEKNGKFISLEVKGHAGSGPYGHDLVCAAVSGILLGGLNNLQDGYQNYKSEVKEGHVYLEALKEVSEHDYIVLETIEKQIESVASSYPKNVKLERKHK